MRLSAMELDENRISVATNAAAGAMFGVCRAELTGDEAEAARVVARRVLEHVNEYDRRTR